MRRKERTHVPTRTNVAEPAHPMGNVLHDTDGAAPRVNVPSRTKTHVIRWDRNADGMKAKHPPKDEPKRGQGKRTFLGAYVRQHVHLQTARHERWEARDTLHPRLSLPSLSPPSFPSGTKHNPNQEATLMWMQLACIHTLAQPFSTLHLDAPHTKNYRPQQAKEDACEVEHHPTQHTTAPGDATVPKRACDTGRERVTLELQTNAPVQQDTRLETSMSRWTIKGKKN